MLCHQNGNVGLASLPVWFGAFEKFSKFVIVGLHTLPKISDSMLC